MKQVSIISLLLLLFINCTPEQEQNGSRPKNMIPDTLVSDGGPAMFYQNEDWLRLQKQRAMWPSVHNLPHGGVKLPPLPVKMMYRDPLTDHIRTMEVWDSL